MKSAFLLMIVGGEKSLQRRKGDEKRGSERVYIDMPEQLVSISMKVKEDNL